MLMIWAIERVRVLCGLAVDSWAWAGWRLWEGFCGELVVESLLDCCSEEAQVCRCIFEVGLFQWIYAVEELVVLRFLPQGGLILLADRVAVMDARMARSGDIRTAIVTPELGPLVSFAFVCASQKSGVMMKTWYVCVAETAT